MKENGVIREKGKRVMKGKWKGRREEWSLKEEREWI